MLPVDKIYFLWHFMVPGGLQVLPGDGCPVGWLRSINWMFLEMWGESLYSPLVSKGGLGALLF